MNDASTRFHRSLAVVIGVDTYGEGIASLHSAVADAKAIGEVLRRDHAYDVWCLLNDDAQLPRLLTLLREDLPGALGPGDRLLFYFAGHGIALDGDAGPAGYLVPARARRSEHHSFLPMHVLHNELTRLPVRHALIILDCCFAGAFRWSSLRDIPVDVPRMYRERYDRYIASDAWQVLTSASSNQLALDMLANARGEGADAHSPFALALLEGLAGAADYTKDSVITADELAIYVRERVAPAAESIGRRQIPLLFPLARHDAGQFIFQVPNRPLALPPAPALDENANPYRGLQSFHEDDHPLFFGRDAVIERLVEAVVARQLTVVVGPSGSGKSSLVHAGLVPVLREQGWTVLPTQRPGREPLAALGAWTRELGTTPDPTDLRASWVAAATERARFGPEHPWLVIVDQFEELLTHRTPEAERATFLDALASSLQADPRLHIVVTVRSDAEPQFHDTPLKPWWLTGRFAVRAMTRNELRQIIEKPAAATVLHFEPSRLVERLLDDVALVPAPLPLLSFALSELYRRCWTRWQVGMQDRELRETDYDEMGSVARALTQRATAVYDAFVAEDAAYSITIRNIISRMVTIIAGEAARCRVLQNELVYDDPAENRRIQDVLQRFHEARLISLGNDKTTSDTDAGAGAHQYAEPAHDELVRGWTKVNEWLDELDKPVGTRAVLAALADAVRSWKNDRQSDSYLWLDPRADFLKDIGRTHLLSLNADEAKFVESSVRLRRRRRARTIAGLTIATIVLAFTAGIALWQRNRAADNATEANRQREIATDNAQRANQNASEASRQRDESRRLLAQAFQDTGRQLSVEERSQEAIPYLVAARDNGADNSMLRMIFSFAAHSLPLLPPFEHGGTVWSAAFSPDGSRIVTTSDDNTARIWDVATGKPLVILEHQSAVLGAAFSLDGRRVTTVTSKTEQVWDAASGKHLIIAPEHQTVARHSDSRADQVNIATSDLYNNAHLRDIATSRSLTVPKDPVYTGRIALSGQEGMRVDRVTTGSARMWDPITSEFLGTSEHRSLVRCVTYSVDGERMAVAYDDHTARVWSITTKKPISPLVLHQDNINHVALSPDGSRLVTASSDNTARVWDVATGKPLAALRHPSFVTSAEFNQDGTRVVTASYDHTARVWDLATARAIYTLQHQGPVWDAKFSPDGTRVVTASHDQTARLWDVGAKPLVSWLQHRGEVNSAVFSVDGTRIVTASEDHTARVWDAATAEPMPYTLQHQGPVSGAAISPDGTRVVTTSNYIAEQEVYGSHARVVSSPGFITCIWDIASGKAITTLRADDQLRVHGATFSSDGKRVMAIDGEIAYIWNAATGKLLASLRHTLPTARAAAIPNRLRQFVIEAGMDTGAVGIHLTGDERTLHAIGADGRLIALNPDGHGGFSRDLILDVNRAAFSPDGTRALTTSVDNKVRIWDTTSSRLLVTFREHGGRINSVIFSSDGTRILTASSDNTARIWNATTGQLLVRLVEHAGTVNSAAFSADGSRVVTASADRTARIWDTVTGRPLATPLEHRGPVNSAAFDPEGIRVVTASDDHTACIWDAVTGKPLASLPAHQGRVKHAAFSPDGARVVITGDDGAASVWETRTDKSTVAEWSAVAARSPFVLQGSMHVRRRTPDASAP